jgi:predicted nucleotidyltransferase
MNIHQQVQSRREEILRIAEDHGARNIRLIGSVARGDEGPKSDLDLLVDFEAGRTLLDHAGLMLDLESLLGFKVDVASERGLRPRVRQRVLAEAQPL